jgi:MYXO-CTERM domain-containing protein
MTYPRPFFLAAIAAVVLFISPRLHAQVLLDGSFETSVIPPSSEVAGAGPDWTSSGAFLVRNDFGNLGNTPYGSQYLGLNPGSFVTQTITGFVAGETYVLGADFVSNGAIGTPQVTFSISGAAVDSQTFSVISNPANNSGFFPFQSDVLLFTAGSSGSATIEIFSINANIAVDNVALFGNAPTSPTAPEPSTYAEMLLGLVALAGFGLMRRRSTRA